LLPGGKVDNRQAAMGKPDATGTPECYGLKKSFTIGTAVGNRVGHAPERYGEIVAKSRRQVARNSTHGNLNNEWE
jgi:hypothetical protein